MCSVSYERQAKIIALIEILASIFSLLVMGITSLVLATSPEIRENILHKDPNNAFNIILNFPVWEKVSLVALPAVYLAGELALAILLYKSVDERNYKRCRTWYVVTITLCMVGLYFFLPGVFFTEDNIWYLSIFLSSYVFTLYSLWVVHHFLNELKAEGLHYPIAPWSDDVYNDKL